MDLLFAILQGRERVVQHSVKQEVQNYWLKQHQFVHQKRVTRVEGIPTRAQRSEHWREGERGAGPASTLIQDFSTSIAAQICTTPILFVAFGQLSPWSPLVNGILLWTIAPMMSLGLLGGLLGLIIEPLGQLIILLTYPLSFLFVKVVELF